MNCVIIMGSFLPWFFKSYFYGQTLVLSQWRPVNDLFALNTGFEYWLPSKPAAAIGCYHDISSFFDSLISMKHPIPLSSHPLILKGI